MAADSRVRTQVETFARGASLGLFHATAEDQSLAGRLVTVGGRRMVDFASCGYIGLSTHPRLINAVRDAVHRYGTQFSISRAYLSAPDYPAAEAALSAMFGRPASLASSTTMANMSAITSLVTAEDMILIDVHAHHSVQMAARAANAPVKSVPHSDIAVLERRIREFSGEHRRVWYLADGLYSMSGDFAPVAELSRLAEENPDLWLFFDDAHATSWTGTHGRGYVLEHLGPAALARTVVTASLNKAFGAGGGAMAFPDEETRDFAFRHGWPMVFSGPLQPPILAAVLASAQLHLTSEITERQARMAELIRFFNSEAARLAIPLVVPSETPIRYVSAGSADAAIDLSSRLQKAGFLVNCVGYPIVPRNRAGIRATITLHQTKADITALVEAIAEQLPCAMAEEQM